MDSYITDTTVSNNDVNYNYRDAPRWKQKIVGKSLPMETFAIKRCSRYFAQRKHLVLPAFEVMFMSNMFKILGKQWQLIENVFKVIETTQKNLQHSSGNFCKQFVQI